MRSELYAALKQAGASDAVAASVAKEVAALDARIAGLEGRVKVLTVAAGLALVTTLAIKMMRRPGIASSISRIRRKFAAANRDRAHFGTGLAKKIVRKSPLQREAVLDLVVDRTI